MRMTIKARLAAVFGTVIVMSGASMYVALQNLDKLNESLDVIVNVRAANAIKEQDIQTHLKGVESALNGMTASRDDATIEKYAKDMAYNREEAEHLFTELDANIKDPTIRASADTVKSNIEAYRAEMAKVEQFAKMNTDP